MGTPRRRSRLPAGAALAAPALGMIVLALTVAEGHSAAEIDAEGMDGIILDYEKARTNATGEDARYLDRMIDRLEIARNMTALQEEFDAGNLPGMTADEYNDEILRLERLLHDNMAVDWRGQPLYKQVQSGIGARYLECSDPRHVLVMSPALNPACLAPGTAGRSGWPEVRFTDDNDAVASSTLEITGKDWSFHVRAETRNGVIQGFWYDESTLSLFLAIESKDGGDARLEIPESLYHLTGPEGASYDAVFVLEDGEEIDSRSTLADGTYVVEFSFSGPGQTIEVVPAYYV